MARKKSKKIQVTKEGLEELKKEFKERRDEIRKKLQDELDEEISEGDISENASYYRVQEEIASNDRRVDELDEMIKNAEIVEDAPANGKAGGAQIGSSVTIKVRGKEITYEIVGSTQADSAQRKITVDSPLGKALVGKKAGDMATVKTPSGSQEYEVVSVE